MTIVFEIRKQVFAGKSFKIFEKMIEKLQYLYGIFNFIITYNSTMDEMNKIYYKF